MRRVLQSCILFIRCGSMGIRAEEYFSETAQGQAQESTFQSSFYKVQLETKAEENLSEAAQSQAQESKFQSSFNKVQLVVAEKRSGWLEKATRELHFMAEMLNDDADEKETKDIDDTRSKKVPITRKTSSLGDLEALVRLYVATGGSQWTNKMNWLNMYSDAPTPPCPITYGSWFGVTCDGDDLTGLVLPNNNLKGKIPSELGLGTSLSELELSSNQLFGSIPSELGFFTNITNGFALNANSLTGSIPCQLGQLTRLSANFNLKANSLTGSVPSQLGLMVTMTVDFLLSNNSLCGDVPPQVEALSSQVALGWEVEQGNSLGTPCCAVQTDLSCEPSFAPSVSPTNSPMPTRDPSQKPSSAPSGPPSFRPTDIPTLRPSVSPTSGPSLVPTSYPTENPIKQPTPTPSQPPTFFCETGTFFDASSCVACSVGRFANTTSPPWATSCRLCPIGKFANQPGTMECSNCPEGKIASPDRVLCADCQAGEYNQNNQICAQCEVGRYAPQPQTGACLFCGAGSSTNAAAGGAAACSPCDPGMFSLGGAVSCTPCETGKFSSSGQSSCTSCERGKYASEVGSASCTPCPLGYASPPASSTCAQSDQGYFLYKGVASWCPRHATCSGGTLMPQPRNGFWVERRELIYSNTIYECPRATCELGTPASLSASTTTITTTAASPAERRRGRHLLNDGSENDAASCWELASYQKDDVVGSECDSDQLLCKRGARGPLCGSCQDLFIYSSTERECIACSTSHRRAILVVGLVGGVALLFAAAYCFSSQLPDFVPSWAQESPVWKRVRGLYMQFDSGDIRVAWANYQIIQSASWTLDVQFPSPFKEMLSALSIFSFDFLSLECLFQDSDHFLSVYLWSLVPVIIAGLLIIFHAIESRCTTFGASSTSTPILTYRLLLLGYLVVPPVTLKQLQALDCVTIAERRLLRIDTSIDCDSDEFQTFMAVDICFLVMYLAIPLVWFILLFRARKRLNPLAELQLSSQQQGGAHRDEDALELALSMRDGDASLQPLRFLFSAYQPEFYYTECLEMYRRVLFVGVIPLLAAASTNRAALGIFFSLCSIALYGEVAPFLRTSTNILAYVAQYANVLTFGAGLAIEVGMDRGMSPFLFGCILVAANTAVGVLVLRASAVRFLRELSILNSRRTLTPEERDLVNAILEHPERNEKNEAVEFSHGKPPFNDSNDFNDMVGIEIKELNTNAAAPAENVVSDFEARSAKALKQSLIDSKDVKMTTRVGAGAFGEVFKGSVMGQPVAVKTMLNVTEENARAFRDEILLTATLRHPNIVSFVGACWTGDLMCLVLEWVPRGSLSDLLEDKLVDLRWDDPLLRLAMDVARGMAYLHGRDYFDERDNQYKQCILHRDLKPDNALVTDFTAVKVTDFGTSRAKAAGGEEMEGVGTPLFCAPEVCRGEAYDEKVDVYSFGMTLIDMASDVFVTTFIGERWRVSFNKKKTPNPQSLAFNKVLRPTWNGEWRPVSNEDPIDFAPPCINDLIVRCTSFDSKSRPSFTEILHELETRCLAEIQGAAFYRHPGEKKTLQALAQHIESSVLRRESHISPLLKVKDGVAHAASSAEACTEDSLYQSKDQAGMSWDSNPLPSESGIADSQNNSQRLRTTATHI